VVSSNSFHHWASQVAGFEEIDRVLAPGGIYPDRPIRRRLAQVGGSDPPSRSNVYQERGGDDARAAGLELLRWSGEHRRSSGEATSLLLPPPTWLRQPERTVDAG